MSHMPKPDKPKSVIAIRESLSDILDAVALEGGRVGEILTVWERRTLCDDTRLIWVSPDMVALMVEVADSIPDDMALDEVQRPPNGLAVFAKSVYGSDALGHEQNVQMDGLLWGPISVLTDQRGERHGVGIATISRVERPDDNLRDGWFPLGRSEWMDDESLNEVIDRDQETTWQDDLRPNDKQVLTAMMDPEDKATVESYNESAIEDRKLAAALFGLMAQKRHVEIGTWRPHNKSSKRKYGNAEVVTVTLRHIANEGTEGGTGSKLDHRTYVAPYFRMQPYGPRRSLRRLQLIEGHVRGPEDAPLVRKKKIWTLRK